MYEPCPATGPVQEPQPIQPPRSVLNAVKLMYAGAAVEVVAVIVALVFRSSLKSVILASHPHYTAAQLHTAEGARTIPLIVGGLIAIGLWLWMAWANGKGLNWARILSAVFFAINTSGRPCRALPGQGRRRHRNHRRGHLAHRPCRDRAPVQQGVPAVLHREASHPGDVSGLTANTPAPDPGSQLARPGQLVRARRCSGPAAHRLPATPGARSRFAGITGRAVAARHLLVCRRRR